jgi:hypothetical protein
MHRCCLEICLAVSVGAILAVSGCQRSPYELAPVHGTVTIDDHPLTQAKVMFAPMEVGDNPNPGKPAFGLIKEDGSFQLTTYELNDGAVVGEHWVTIINLAKKPKHGEAAVAGAALQNGFTRLTMPQRVNVVADQSNEIPIKLTSKDVARYGAVVSD